MTKSLIQLENLDVVLNSQPILHDISWQLCSGENWAFLGANGAGKSTLMQLARGEIWPVPAKGKRVYRFDDVETSSPLRARENIAFVTGAQHEKYRRQEWDLNGRDVLLSGFFGTELLHQKPTETQQNRVDEVAQHLAIEELLPRDINTLSHGELRRLLLARALVTKPKLLVLDEFCSGLDAVSRAQILEFLNVLATQNVQLLLVTHRRDEIVAAITHVAQIENGRIVAQGEKAAILARKAEVPAHIEYSNSSKNTSNASNSRVNSNPEITTGANGNFANARDKIEFGANEVAADANAKNENSQIASITNEISANAANIENSANENALEVSENSRNTSASNENSDAKNAQVKAQYETLVEVKNADVFNDGAHILHDINWTWRAGEHWRVRGENGSGKSTFLKLLAAELWPALGGEIARFDGFPFRDVWEMKARIGVVSPALQERYRDDVSAEEIVASGFFSSFGVRTELSNAQETAVSDLMQRCGIANLRGKRNGQMSQGEARKTLLARALINNPDLLLLDEPFDSLDEFSVRDFKQILDEAAQNGTHILLVSHHDEDAMLLLTHEIHFQNGQIASQKSLVKED